MQDFKDRIVVNENGVFIPRTLFGQKDQIIDELDQAGVFSPPQKAKISKQPVRVEMPDRSREMRWLKEHRSEYAGQWVALDGDRLLSHGTDAHEVFAAARESGVEAPFFAHLEPEDALPFGGW